MKPESLRDFLRAQPFEPFAIILSNGSRYEVRHPELLMVGREKAAVGVSLNPESTIFDSVIHVSLLHIASVEPLATSGGHSTKE